MYKSPPPPKTLTARQYRNMRKDWLSTPNGAISYWKVSKKDWPTKTIKWADVDVDENKSENFGRKVLLGPWERHEYGTSWGHWYKKEWS